MNKPYSGNSAYIDCLCVFRCLAYHKHGLKCYKLPTMFKNIVYRYFNIYFLYQGQRMEPADSNPFSFPGIEMEALHHVENCFKININVYNKTEKSLCMILKQSLDKYEDDLNLQEYMAHLSYIANFPKKIECTRCEKIFSRRQDYNWHLSACPNTVRHSYPGGYFALKRIIFEILEEVGVYVQKMKGIIHILLHTISKL